MINTNIIFKNRVKVEELSFMQGFFSNDKFFIKLHHRKYSFNEKTIYDCLRYDNIKNKWDMVVFQCDTFVEPVDVEITFKV